jgi:hypothetical protein
MRLEASTFYYLWDRLPRRLLGRLACERRRDELALDPPSVLTGAMDVHWLDRFDREWKGHIRQVERIRDRLMAEARPPQALFESVAEDPEALVAGARFNQLYATTIKRLQRREFGGRQKETNAGVQQEVTREMSQLTGEGRRALLVKWEFEKAWRALAFERGNGAMGEAEYMEAVAQAQQGVERMDNLDVAIEIRMRLSKRAARCIEQEQKRGLSKEALEEVRETMEQFLAQWGEDRQTAVLRGALASVFLSDRRKLGKDVGGVWLMGQRQADGTNVLGIVSRTIQALAEIEVMSVEFDEVLCEVGDRQGEKSI